MDAAAAAAAALVLQPRLDSLLTASAASCQCCALRCVGASAAGERLGVQAARLGLPEAWWNLEAGVLDSADSMAASGRFGSLNMSAHVCRKHEFWALFR